MAMKEGACYIPLFLSASCDVPAPGRVKYAHSVFGDGEGATPLFQRVVFFWRSPPIPLFLSENLLESLKTKAIFFFVFEARPAVLWQRLMKRAYSLIAS